MDLALVEVSEGVLVEEWAVVALVILLCRICYYSIAFAW